MVDSPFRAKRNVGQGGWIGRMQKVMAAEDQVPHYSRVSHWLSERLYIRKVVGVHLSWMAS